MHFPLSVPFDSNAIVKARGASWDTATKTWVAKNMCTALRCPEYWNGKEPAGRFVRKWLNVSFEDRDFAKAIGAKWDPDYKAWYCPGDMTSEMCKFEFK